MKQTLKQRIGTGIVLAAAGLGSLVGLSGCETTPAQDYAISGVVSQNATTINPNISYRDSQIMGIGGGLLGVLAQQEAMKEAAREGKSEVNVNISGSPDKDIIYMKDGSIIEGEISDFPEGGNYIRIRQGASERLIPKHNVKNYVDR